MFECCLASLEAFNFREELDGVGMKLLKHEVVCIDSSIGNYTLGDKLKDNFLFFVNFLEINYKLLEL